MHASAAQHQDWWLRANFYSLYIDRFSGDIPTLIDQLDYFVDLGIDCLHILPHYPSPDCDGGFDITDHTGVRSTLGTVADFERLCNTAHAKGLKIMVDLVLNHTSDEHPWFMAARTDRHSDTRNWYLWSETGTEFADTPLLFTDFKTSYWQWNEATGDYYFSRFKPCQPDLNWDNPAVMNAMFAIVDTLVGYGVDAFRLDAIMKLMEREHTDSLSLPETHARVQALRAHLAAHHPHVALLGEVMDTTVNARTYFGKGDECHLTYNFEIMNEMLYALVCGSESDRLRLAVETARAIPPHTSWLAFLRNHDSVNLSIMDTVRSAELLGRIDPTGAYVFNQGTETTQRLYNILGGDEARIRAAFSMLYALPTATVMYYGDEIGLANAPMPAGETDVRLVSRGQFDWERARAQQADPNSLWHHVRRCIAKR